nr:TOBE domain-containing protein [Puniceibacterium sediminis]
MNFIPATVQAGRAVTAFGPLGPKTDLRDGSRVAVCARPEHLFPGAGETLGKATVRESVFQGSSRRVTVTPEAAPDTTLRAQLPVGMDAMVNDVLTLALDSGHVTLLEDA